MIVLAMQECFLGPVLKFFNIRYVKVKDTVMISFISNCIIIGLKELFIYVIFCKFVFSGILKHQVYLKVRKDKTNI